MSNTNSAEPFPFEAFAQGRLREREARQRGLWKSVFALLKSHDFVGKAQGCPFILTGSLVLLMREFDKEGFLPLARAIGLGETEGYEEPKPEMMVEPIQVLTRLEPAPSLRERLVAEGFHRMTPPGVEPVIYMGRGILAAWRAAGDHDTRVTRCDLPGGTIHGASVGPEEGGGAVGADESGSADDLDEAAGQAAGSASGLGGRRVAAVSDASSDGATEVLPNRPYQWAALPAPPKGWMLHAAADADRDALVLAVVTQQGPVDLDVAVEAVRRGLKMASIRANGRQKIEDALGRLLSAGDVIESDGFYLVPSGPVLARDRTGFGERVRRLSALSGIEIDAAIREAIERGNRSAASVVVGAAGLLGYPLKTPATHPVLAGRVSTRIDHLVAGGTMIREEAGLSLAPPPADPTADVGPGTRTDLPSSYFVDRNAAERDREGPEKSEPPAQLAAE